MIFAVPQMLWLLLILVLPLSGFLWWTWRKRQELITQFISSRLLSQLKVGVSPGRQKARLVMIVPAVVFIILALARPQWGVTREEARQRGLDIIVAIDTSNSMLAEDVSPTRLARAKLAALDLLHRARTDRLGLVAFAGSAFLQCPLTLDDGAFTQSVNALDTKTISQGGTAIADAIEEAGKAFKNESDNHRVLVLFTDGEDHDSDAVAAATKAAKDGMIIFTIGIGTSQGEVLRIHDEHGRLDYIRDEQGQPVKSKLDEDILQQIARATKGFYLPLRGTKTMDTLYDQGLAPLPKTEKSVKMFQNFHERFQWFLGVTIALLLLEMFLPDRKRRRPKTAAPTAPSPQVTETVVVLLLALSLSASASPSSALREYNAGNYQDALKDYNHLLENKQDDPRLHFNAGTAAYQSRQLDQAQKEFNAALASPDLQMQQRAYYNLGNTLFRAGQQATDAAKKQEAWENAIKNYESAAKLNQQDQDAHFNQDFVKKQLEELKKQQQQSQKDSDKNQKNKNDKNKKDQQNQQDKQNQQDQKNQSGDDKQQQGQNQSQDKNKQDKNQPDKNSQSENKPKEKADEEKKQQSAQEKKDGDKKNDEKKQDEEQNQAGDQSKEQTAEDAKREAAMMAAGQMTPQQAKQLLDAEKNDEHVFQMSPTNKNVSQGRSFKNW